MGLLNTELQKYVAEHGSELRLDGLTLTIGEVSTAGEVAHASITRGRAYYLGILCAHAKIKEHPGAEIWKVISGPKEIALLAVAGGRVINVKKQPRTTEKAEATC